MKKWNGFQQVERFPFVLLALALLLTLLLPLTGCFESNILKIAFNGEMQGYLLECG